MWKRPYKGKVLDQNTRKSIMREKVPMIFKMIRLVHFGRPAQTWPSLLTSDWSVFRRRRGPDVQEDRGRQQPDNRREDRQRDRVLHPAERRRSASELMASMHAESLNFLSSDVCGSFESRIRTCLQDDSSELLVQMRKSANRKLYLFVK